MHRSGICLNVAHAARHSSTTTPQRVKTASRGRSCRGTSATKKRPWTKEEIKTRYFRLLMDIKDELTDGRLYNQDGTRMMVLGLLLENQGLDNAVQFG